MEHRHQTVTYRGHELRITASESKPGWWSWVYLIDGRTASRSAAGALLRDAEAAIRRATNAARARVDGMEG